MRRFLPVLAICALLVSCRFADDIVSGGNPFSTARDLTKGMVVTGVVDNKVLIAYESGISYSGEHWQEGEYVEFPLVTDVHIGMEDTDNVTQHEEDFIAFIKGKDYPFAVCLGDIVDDGEFYDSRVIDFITRSADEVNGNFVEAVGNHDRREHSQSTIDKFLSEFNGGRIEKMVFDQLSLYKLDNSLRTYGKDQLKYLEDALEDDDNPCKLILAHENLIAGTDFDMTLFYTGTGDIAERNRLLRIMKENGAGLILTGHTHTGNKAVKVTSTLAEFNAASCIEEEQGNGRGYCYTVRVSFTDKVVTITAFDVATGDQKDTYSFNLP